MAEAIVRAEGLGKTFRVAVKQPGLSGSLRHLVRRRYRDVAAVQQLSFAIQPGEVVGFLGPNGARKTTTVNMLNGQITLHCSHWVVAGIVHLRPRGRRLLTIAVGVGGVVPLSQDSPSKQQKPGQKRLRRRCSMMNRRSCCL